MLKDFLLCIVLTISLLYGIDCNDVDTLFTFDSLLSRGYKRNIASNAITLCRSRGNPQLLYSFSIEFDQNQNKYVVNLNDCDPDNQLLGATPIQADQTNFEVYCFSATKETEKEYELFRNHNVLLKTQREKNIKYHSKGIAFYGMHIDSVRNKLSIALKHKVNCSNDDCSFYRLDFEESEYVYTFKMCGHFCLELIDISRRSDNDCTEIENLKLLK